MKVDPYAPCYHIDPSTKQIKAGQYNNSEFLRQLQQQDTLQIGTKTLSAQEIQQLAAEYDPSNMSQKEYSEFIDLLVRKGVLGSDETYDLGLARVTLRPGQLMQGGTAPNLSQKDLSIRTLKDAQGDALHLVDVMAKWCAGEAKVDKVKMNALSKVEYILREMKSYRAK